MEPVLTSLPAELSVADAATLLGLSTKRTAEYTVAGVLPHRIVPSRTGRSFTWRVTTVHVLALAAARQASRARYAELRAAGWWTVTELMAYRGVVASTITRAIARGDLQVEQFPHEAGSPYLIAPSSLPPVARPHCPTRARPTRHAS